MTKQSIGHYPAGSEVVFGVLVDVLVRKRTGACYWSFYFLPVNVRKMTYSDGLLVFKAQNSSSSSLLAWLWGRFTISKIEQFAITSADLCCLERIMNLYMLSENEF